MAPVTMSSTAADAVAVASDNDAHSFEVLTVDVLFVIMLLFLGATVFMSLRCRLPLPYTVLQFLYGIAMGAITHWVSPRVAHTLGSIPAELLFYVFLPVLIFEGSYAMNIHALRRVAWHAGLLATVGLVINTVLLAVPAKALLPSLSWYTVLLLGSLLSASDPVAVVALLKSLGVEKCFTAMLDGESVLNDGTAIILFTLLLPAVRAGGVQTPAWSMALTALRLCVLPILVGPLFGFAVYQWLRHTREDLTKACVTVSATYVAYYVSYFLIGTSGVLTVFFQGVFLSYYYPSLFPGREHSLIHGTWQFLVHLANTVLFALVGIILVNDALLTWQPMDVLIIAAMYIVVNVGRLVMLEMLLPALNASWASSFRLRQRDVVFMTHAGLRGGVAVTLALGLKQSGIADGGVVLRVTSGVVMLSLLVNATSAEYVMRQLGLDCKAEHRVAQMHYAVTYLASTSARALVRMKCDTKYQDANWLLVERYVRRHLPNPYARVPVVAEDETVRLNRLLMIAFKVSLWRQCDEKRISETAVVQLGVLVARLIDEGELLDVRRLDMFCCKRRRRTRRRRRQRPQPPQPLPPPHHRPHHGNSNNPTDTKSSRRDEDDVDAHVPSYMDAVWHGDGDARDDVASARAAAERTADAAAATTRRTATASPRRVGRVAADGVNGSSTTRPCAALSTTTTAVHLFAAATPPATMSAAATAATTPTIDAATARLPLRPREGDDPDEDKSSDDDDDDDDSVEVVGAGQADKHMMMMEDALQAQLQEEQEDEQHDDDDRGEEQRPQSSSPSQQQQSPHHDHDDDNDNDDDADAMVAALMGRLLPPWVVWLERVWCAPAAVAAAHRRAQEGAFVVLLAVAQCLRDVAAMKYCHVQSPTQARRVERWLRTQLCLVDAAIRFFYHAFPAATNNVASTRAVASVTQQLQHAVGELHRHYGVDAHTSERLVEAVAAMRVQAPARWHQDVPLKQSDLVLRAVAASTLGRGLRYAEVRAIACMGLVRRLTERRVLTLPRNAFLIVVFGSVRAVHGTWTTVAADALVESFGDTVGLASLLLPTELCVDQQRRWRVTSTEATVLLISYNSVRPFLMERSLRAVKALWRAAAAEVLLPLLQDKLTMSDGGGGGDGGCGGGGGTYSSYAAGYGNSVTSSSSGGSGSGSGGSLRTHHGNNSRVGAVGYYSNDSDEDRMRARLISAILHGTPLIGPAECTQFDWSAHLHLCFYLRGADEAGMFSRHTPPCYVSTFYARQLRWRDADVVLYAVPVSLGDSGGYVPWTRHEAAQLRRRDSVTGVVVADGNGGSRRGSSSNSNSSSSRRSSGSSHHSNAQAHRHEAATAAAATRVTTAATDVRGDGSHHNHHPSDDDNNNSIAAHPIVTSNNTIITSNNGSDNDILVPPPATTTRTATTDAAAAAAAATTLSPSVQQQHHWTSHAVATQLFNRLLQGRLPRRSTHDSDNGSCSSSCSDADGDHAHDHQDDDDDDDDDRAHSHCTRDTWERVSLRSSSSSSSSSSRPRLTALSSLTSAPAQAAAMPATATEMTTHWTAAPAMAGEDADLVVNDNNNNRDTERAAAADDAAAAARAWPGDGVGTVCVLQRLHEFVTPVPYVNQLFAEYATMLEAMCVAALRYLRYPHDAVHVRHAESTALSTTHFLLRFCVELSLLRRATRLLRLQHPTAFATCSSSSSSVTAAAAAATSAYSDEHDADLQSKACAWLRNMTLTRRCHLRTIIVEMCGYANARFQAYAVELRVLARLAPELCRVESVEGLHTLLPTLVRHDAVTRDGDTT